MDMGHQIKYPSTNTSPLSCPSAGINTQGYLRPRSHVRDCTWRANKQRENERGGSAYGKASGRHTAQQTTCLAIIHPGPLSGKGRKQRVRLWQSSLIKHARPTPGVDWLGIRRMCAHITRLNCISVAHSNYRNERRWTNGKQKTDRSIRLVWGGDLIDDEEKITKQRCVSFFFFRQHFFNTKSTYLHTQWFLTNYCRVRSNSLNVIALGPHTKENNSAEYGNFIIFLFSLAVVCIRFLSLFLLLFIFILPPPTLPISAKYSGHFGGCCQKKV